MKKTEKESKVVMGYKAFNWDWTCRNFKFEVGKKYHEDNIDICSSGFHFCKRPIDVLNYYENLPNQKYAIVEASGKINERADKCVTTDIFIVREISVKELFEANTQLIESEAVDKQSNTGYRSSSSNTGWRSSSSNTGDQSSSSNTGNRSSSSNTGDQSSSSNTGDQSSSSNTGNQSSSSNTGNQSISSNTGNQSISSNTGDQSSSSNTGDRSSSSNTGWRSSSSNTGDRSSSSNTGCQSSSSNTGYRSISSNTGGQSSSSNTGDQSSSSNTGDRSSSSNTGWRSSSSNTGDRSISLAWGISAKAMTKSGYITIVDWRYENTEWVIKAVYTKTIGEKIGKTKIEPMTYYWFEDGELKSEKAE